MVKSDLASEWCLLQNQFDSYEKYSLLIKLVSVVVLSAVFFSNRLSVVVLFLLLILWLQDAIWKTFQSRIENRLLQLEGYLSNKQTPEDGDSRAYQFNSVYSKSRPSTIGLIHEYLHQAIRPTIAFPHVALLLMAGSVLFVS
ncbi:hypothetical protein [Sedimenticola selenatireducens]|uniref:Uncharacterized protein n=1 Tax=Sedimenticola selenatireducens TaxID=191960 RepID=A0A557SN16_9GAMM|nr:hypothetical protein [Sedimenticola selenatireducens]TVO78702.1 hypothetical protein FHP88_00645 [Sedimenticola selenatireducens]TVT62064.1 MAG: hypothetical protein FHK78_15760 [Sedimenticola selenatireducens]